MSFIKDPLLQQRWQRIKIHLHTTPKVYDYNGILSINKHIYLAKKTTKMRIKSHLDWVWYTPKTLARAIDTDTVEEYYEIMMQHVNSDPNVWNDHDFEMELKSYYASREGRASLLP
jgi:hypothetical protein